MTTQARTTLAMALAFAIAVGTGALLSSTVDGGETTRSLPAIDEPIPVLAPVAAGPDAPPFPTATGDSGSGGSGGGGGGGGGGGPAPAAASVVEPVSSGTPADLDDPSLAGLGVGGEPGDPVEPLVDVGDGRVLRGPHFEDPCSRHGSIDCGAHAIPGTVLGGDAGDEGEVGRAGAALDDPPPLWVRVFPGLPPGGPLTNRCRARDVGAGEYPVAILVLNPADITLTYHLYSFTSAEPILGTIRVSSAGTSHPERHRWQEWFDDGTLNSAPDRRVQHCVGIPDLDDLSQYVVNVSATDIFGQSAVYESSFQPQAGRRPPTIITPVDDGRIAVRAAHRLGQIVRVEMVPATGDDATDCAAAEATGAPRADVPGEIHAIVPSEAPLADDAPGSVGDYEYDAPLVFAAHEGTQYFVCLWWTRRGVRSFDHPIDEREVHSVRSPNRYGARVTVEGVTTNRTIDPGGLALHVEGGWPHCFGESTTPLPAGDHADFRLEVCSLDHGEVFPDVLSLKVTGPHDRTLTYAIDVPGRPCTLGGGCTPTVEQWYEVTIPNQVAVRRLCTGSCDPPSRRESAGSALVHAVFADGPNDGGTSWDIGIDSRFAGAPPSEPPPWPQLDRTGSRVVAVDAHTFHVTWGADRPVVVHGVVTAEVGAGVLDAPPCLRSGDGTFTTTALASSGGFDIGGLCANTRYRVALELTGEGGERLVYGHGDPTWGGAFAQTPGFSRVVYVTGLFTAFPGGAHEAGIHDSGIDVDGLPVAPFPYYCFSDATHSFGPVEVPTTVGDLVTVSFVFQDSGGCRGLGTDARTELTREVPIADLDRGLTFESPPGDTLGVHVFVQTNTP